VTVGRNRGVDPCERDSHRQECRRRDATALLEIGGNLTIDAGGPSGERFGYAGRRPYKAVGFLWRGIGEASCWAKTGNGR